MITIRFTSSAQTTVPHPVRSALALRDGDEIAYAIEAGGGVDARPPRHGIG